MTAQLNVAAPATPFARVMGFGSYRGSRIVDNFEICKSIDSTDEWIQQRSGIIERRWATDEETPLFMATKAAQRAIENAGIEKSQIDAVIVGTVSQFKQFPSLAAELSGKLELANPAAYDISAGCAAFCYSLGQADAMIRSGSAKYVLIACTEKLTTHTDFTDRGTAFLFGDGAGAAVVGPSEFNGISPTVWGADGSQADVIYEPDWSKAWDNNEAKPKLKMDGHTVYRWATSFIAQKAVEVLETSGLDAQQLDVFVPHQANNRITDSMIRRMKLPESVVVSRDIKYMGNTSGASIPIAIDGLLSSGEAKSGQLALLIAFGTGLAYAGQVIVLP